jgi:hypothetical protein
MPVERHHGNERHLSVIPHVGSIAELNVMLKNTAANMEGTEFRKNGHSRRDAGEGKTRSAAVAKYV